MDQNITLRKSILGDSILSGKPDTDLTFGLQAKSDPTKFSGKKSKATAKKGKGTSQYEILQKSDIPESEIPSFRVSSHWLGYFPPMAVRDLKAMGCGVDWRRSFITTDMNPYYDSFVQWQFNTLLKLGKVVKDKR